ncbi:MAG: RagB/SusD family nutrient uptake outer membrane protein [Bacteroides sp.]|nr:RagB/SusD family nutrient uptake outer membrane protein [Bacteroides sp.]
MKAKYIITALASVITGMALTSCSDMLKTDTESYLDIEGLGTYNANDSLYSAMGVVRQLQNLGERYMLLGELRGDLVEVPSTADYNLQEISNFSISSENIYSSKRDYYSVINNCNFALTKLDTLIMEHNRKVLLPDYVSIRTMRDWTYLQLGLTFGKAAWITEPLLSLEDTEKNHSVITLDEIVDNIISDLTPYTEAETFDYGLINNYDSKCFTVSPTLMLADLMLYKNRYEEAASLYYRYITNNNKIINSLYGNQWKNSLATEIKETPQHATSYISEVLAMIPYSSDAKDLHPNLVNLTYNPEPSLLPAEWWIRDMKIKAHYFADNEDMPYPSAILEGDTRGEMIPSGTGQTTLGDAFISAGILGTSIPALIAKFYNNANEYSVVSNPNNSFFENGNQRILTAVALYRIPHLYLRYAEAANRAGKPTIAFAVIKYGLRNEVLNNEAAINPEERADGAIWTNFEAATFNDNRGTASRGRGLGVAKASEFVIPELPSRIDSIEWVENLILDEMAAETAYEGNRFFDLLRMSRHNSNPDEWFADKVSRRFPDPVAAKSRLINPELRWLK